MSRLVEAAVFLDPGEAAVAASLLDAHGLTVFRDDSFYTAANWPHLFALGGVRLRVPADEAETARELLATRDDAMAEGGVEACPSCGSGNICRRRSWIVGLIGLAWAVPTLVTTRRRRCRRCGRDWSVDGGWRIG